MKVGSKIKMLRIQKGLSQEYIAEVLNISQSTLSNIESNRSTPNIKILQKIADILEIDIQDFLITKEDTRYESEGLIVNQLTERLIEQYEQRIIDLKEIIKDLTEKLD